jgi:hypothetical protein
MSTNQPSWEGSFLAFAMIFTVLIGSAVLTLALRYLRRPRT